MSLNNEHGEDEQHMNFFTVALQDPTSVNVHMNKIRTATTGSSVMVRLQVQGEPVDFQLDTGAVCNVLRRNDLPKEA